MSTNYSTAHTHTPYGKYANTPQKKDCRFGYGNNDPFGNGTNDSSYYYGREHDVYNVEPQPVAYPPPEEMYPAHHTVQPKERSCIRKPVNIFSLITGFLGAGAVAAAEILPHTTLSTNPMVTSALKPLLYGGVGSLGISIGAQILKCLSRSNCTGPDTVCCCACGGPDCDCDCDID